MIVDDGSVDIGKRVKEITQGEMAFGAIDPVAGEMTGTHSRLFSKQAPCLKIWSQISTTSMVQESWRRRSGRRGRCWCLERLGGGKVAPYLSEIPCSGRYSQKAIACSQAL